MKMHFSTPIVVYFIFLIKCQPTTAEKNYEVEIESFEPNNVKTGTFDPKTLRVNRKGRNNYVVSGEFSLLINLGDESTMVYEFQKKSEISNKYISVLKGGSNICKFCATNTNFYPRFRTFTDFPEPETCPFPKGNYTIKDFTFDDQSFPATVPSGTYILKTYFSKNNEIIFGYTLQFTVTRGK